MKSALLILFILLLAGICVKGQEHIVRTHKDPAGFTYETVSNDPVGLRVYTLKNGLKVYLAHNYTQARVLYATAVRAGSVYDPSDNTGLAHYLEHLLFNGTDQLGSLNWSKEEPILKEIETLYEFKKKEKDVDKKQHIQHLIDSLSYAASEYGIKGEYRKLVTDLGGVATNATTNFEKTVYGSLIPDKSLKNFLMLEKERFRNPSLRAFQTELEIVYEEFNSIQDNAFFEKYNAINKLLFKKHPYGQQQVIGTAEHLKNPSIKSIRDYFQTYYVPNNMAVILVGNINFDSTILWVNNAFGSWKAKTIARTPFEKEELITVPLEKELQGTQPASVFLGFRMGGAGTEDEKYMTVLDKMLTNDVAGLFDLELKGNQKLKNASSFGFFVNRDYSVHYMDGSPNDGQSLEDVKKQMLSLLGKIKKGDFEEWLIQASVNDIIKSFMEEITGNNLETIAGEAFTKFQSWSSRLTLMDELKKISKPDLVAFVNRVYKDNYAVLYKRKSDTSSLVKVENPKITPIRLNEDKQSVFSKQFSKIPLEPMRPEFVDYKNEIKYANLPNGISVAHVPNTKNNLFELDIIFDMGRNNDKKILLAANYANQAGTNRYTASQLKKEFYKLGLSFNINSQNTQTVFHLAGLQDNIDQGIVLVDQIFSDLQQDRASYNNYVQNILNNRKNAKTSRNSIMLALTNLALYGDDSPSRNIYPEDEMRNINPQELTDLIKDLRNYKHRIFYYGNNLSNTLTALASNYHAPSPVKEIPSAKQYIIMQTKPIVYFVNYNAAQADVKLISRGNRFNINNSIFANMFNRFIEKAAFNRVREARSLAYTNWATYFVSDDNTGYDYMAMYAGTQVNKLADLLEVMTIMMKNISGLEPTFNQAKTNQLTRFETERIIGPNIFWTFESLRRQGFEYDFRKDMYETIQKMKFTEMQSFFEKNIAANEMSVLIIGNKNDIDLKGLAKYGEVKEISVDDLFNYR